MEPALKQRLIGAAVLVALAVIFLPMLLNGPAPPPSPAANVPLDAPQAPGAPLQTREIPLTLPGQPTAADPAAPPAPAADDPNRVVTVDAEDAPRIDARPEDALPAASPATEPAAPTSTAAEPAAPAPDAPVATAATAPAQPPAAQDPPPAAPAAPPAAPGGRYVVNLGSYGSAANASAVQATLKKGGVAVYAESIDLEGKPAQRLRAGPFATRADAEAARLAVRRLQADLPATVTALDDAEPAPAAPAPTAVAGGFAVQVAAFKSENEANALRDKLRGGGFAAYSERATTANGTMWRVRVGPELQRARADQLKASLQQRFQLDGNIVTHP